MAFVPFEKIDEWRESQRENARLARIRNKRMLILFLLYSLAVFFSYHLFPESILYNKDTLTIMWPIIILIWALPIAISIFLRRYHWSKLTEFRFEIFFFAGWLGFIPSDYYRIYEVNKELKTNGIRAKAVVMEEWEIFHSRGYTGWLIRCEFTPRNSNLFFHTFPQEDHEHQYHLGDTLTVLYLPRNPEISRVVELEDKTR